MSFVDGYLIVGSRKFYVLHGRKAPGASKDVRI
jgi:hypothetical protein